jgi:hypothetical protein
MHHFTMTGPGQTWENSKKELRFLRGMDSGGTTHIPGTNYNNFAWENADAQPCVRQHCPADYSEPIRPTENMCKIFEAWEAMIAAAPRITPDHVAADVGGDVTADVTDGLEPWRYDLVNTGREVLNQLMLPTSQKFNMSLNDSEALATTSTACERGATRLGSVSCSNHLLCSVRLVTVVSV